VGAALVQAGLAACAQAGEPVVFVLGHASYYPRFGFRPAAALGITSEWPVHPEVFMVAALQPGGLAGRHDTVHYAPPFHAA
jgi:putative acetyltransferase